MKKIILIGFALFLLVLNFFSVNGDILDETHGQNPSSTTTDTLERGYNITTQDYTALNVSVYIKGVKRDSQDNTPQCAVYNISGNNHVAMQYATFVGDVCTFSKQVYLNENTIYRVTLFGSSSTKAYDTASYLPVSNTYIEFTDDIFWNSGWLTPASEYIWGLINVTLNISGLTPLPPTLNINHNLSNTININSNTLSFGYNGTYSNTTDLFNCSLGWDGIINQTYEVNLSNNQNFIVNYGDLEENISVNIYCENSDVSDNTTIYYYAIDTIQPDIYLINPISLNNSNFVQDTTLTTIFNLTDTNAFAYNISWYKPNGDLIQEIYVENLTGISYLNTSSYLLSVTGTNYSIIVWMADSHNPVNHKVTPLHWYTDNINLFAEDFMFSGDFKFYNKKGDLITYFYLNENKYKIKLTFNEDSYFHNITLKGISGLKYVNQYGYKGHFVYLPKMRYIDFEGSNIKSVKQYNCNTDYCLQIELFEKSNEIELESIGDLNYNEKRYYFSVYSQDSALLQELIDINNNILDTNNEISEGVNMIAWIVLLIFNIIFYIFLTVIKKEEFAGLLFLNFIIFMALMLIFNTLNESVLMYVSIGGIVLVMIELFNENTE